MRVARNLQVPAERSKEILQQAKVIILIKSTQIRWFLRQSGGRGWSSRAEAQQRPRISKLRAKRLYNYHTNETVVEAARRGASGQNKRATFTIHLLKKES
jgi:hypothetical protein